MRSGAQRIPDPTTAGDFCRRFDEPAIEALQTAINETRVRVWRAQPAAFFDEAVIDADGTLAETTGQCKEGMDIAYNGVWGYHPLVVSLANTQEPLFLVNRSGNRPSAEGAAERFDQARALCRDAGFRRITFRGDTDFTQTRHLDRWDADGVRFVFGYDARANVIALRRRVAGRARGRRWSGARRHAVADRAAPAARECESRHHRRRAAFKNLRLDGGGASPSFRISPRRARSRTGWWSSARTSRSSRATSGCSIEIRYFFYLTNDRRHRRRRRRVPGQRSVQSGEPDRSTEARRRRDPHAGRHAC